MRFSAATLLSLASSGAAVLVRQSPLNLDMAGLELEEHLEDATLSTMLQKVYSRFNTSSAWVKSMGDGLVTNFFKQTGSEDKFRDLARHFPSMASNGTKLQQAMDLAQRTVEDNPHASVKELARLTLEAVRGTGVREDLKRLAAYPFPGENGVFSYTLDALQAGITVQGPFPVPGSAATTGWGMDFFVVGNRKLDQYRDCVSFRVSVSDDYSQPFVELTHAVFGGMSSWGSVIDRRNMWTYGVSGGPRLSGFAKGFNAISAEVSYSMDKLHQPSLKSLPSSLYPDNFKVMACAHNPRACTDPTFFKLGLTIFGEMTYCHDKLVA